MSNKNKPVHIYVWPDGEYLHEGQIDGEITTSLGYTKSDDYETIELKHGTENYIDLNGLILQVELDHWGCVWERGLWKSEPPYEGV